LERGFDLSIVIEGGRVPFLLRKSATTDPAEAAQHDSSALRIALVNNMPDAALEDTEVQFTELLSAAADGLPISLTLVSLPNLPRGAAGLEHLGKYYIGMEELFTRRFDGMIVTGTEPRRPDLREEPYWPGVVALLEWAENNTRSTVLSCLAAHAGVLASDGISRTPFADKKFGVFEHAKVTRHDLTEGLDDTVRIPHSRWNDVKAEALGANGFEILTQSPEAGVDLFVKQRGNSLFVHFQGHPEYSARTLLKEYRRDIKRYLRRERETFPTQPQGYFDAGATSLLREFQELAEKDAREGTLEQFPEAAVAAGVQNFWRDPAVKIYRNWLKYLIQRKADAASLSSMSPAVRA
jgi:homoserine O-succinyltransferase/O-acetyltransferase